MAGKIPPQFLANVKKRQGASSSGSADQSVPSPSNPFGNAPANDPFPKSKLATLKDNPFAKGGKGGKKAALTAAQKKAARKRALQNLQQSKKG